MQQAALFETDLDFFCLDDSFLAPGEACRLTSSLWDQLQWSQFEITLFGRTVAQPRLSAWYGDPEARYRYSGLQLEPLPWLPLLLDLKDRVENACRHEFNSVLANAYRSGEDSMGWHSDDEPELGAKPLVASLSLGAERRFLVRRKGESKSAGFRLGNGSLLVMKQGCQENYQHALPKTRKPVGLRINLTFRQIKGQLPP